MTGRTGEFLDPSQSIAAKETAKNITAGQNTLINGLTSLNKLSNAVIIAGTVADVALNVADNREAKKMKEEQEKNLKERQKREKKKRRRQGRTARHPLNTSGVVQEMFNQSIGHTSYGASRLPGL